MRGPIWIAVVLLAACDEAPVGPQPDRPVAMKPVEGPPPSHRPIVEAAPPPVKATPAPAPAPVEAPPAVEKDLGLDPFSLRFLLSGGPPKITLRAGIDGDLRGATVWVTVDDGRNAVLRRGTLTPLRVAELWKRLDALGWAGLPDDVDEGIDAPDQRLTLRRGDRRHTVSRRVGIEEKGAPAPTRAAFETVAGLFEKLPEQKWKTNSPGKKALGLPIDWRVVLEGGVVCTGEEDALVCPDGTRLPHEHLRETGGRWLGFKKSADGDLVPVAIIAMQATRH